MLSIERMNGHWEQFLGRMQQRWGLMTNDRINVIKGRRKELIGRIKELHAMVHRNDVNA
jgi:uncharacterized protein YjbJ (UPF0337 family)